MQPSRLPRQFNDAARLTAQPNAKPSICEARSRHALYRLVNDRASVLVEMAYRLSKAFGSTAETRLGMQMAFDLA